jgi:hypothetical protein
LVALLGLLAGGPYPPSVQLLLILGAAVGVGFVGGPWLCKREASAAYPVIFEDAIRILDGGLLRMSPFVSVRRSRIQQIRIRWVDALGRPAVGSSAGHALVVSIVADGEPLITRSYFASSRSTREFLEGLAETLENWKPTASGL